jgi:hypothetical protein
MQRGRSRPTGFHPLGCKLSQESEIALTQERVIRFGEPLAIRSQRPRGSGTDVSTPPTPSLGPSRSGAFFCDELAAADLPLTLKSRCF